MENSILGCINCKVVLKKLPGVRKSARVARAGIRRFGPGGGPSSINYGFLMELNSVFMGLIYQKCAVSNVLLVCIILSFMVKPRNDGYKPQ